VVHDERRGNALVDRRQDGRLGRAAWWLIRRSGRTVHEVIGITNWQPALRWGGGLGLLAAATRVVPAILGGQPLMPPMFNPALFNTLVIAPTHEELLARGALMGTLQQRWSSWAAIVAAALMFVGMHIPGWYFMGTLAENMARPVGGALSIFLLGLAFENTVQRNNALLGGITAHFLNNLAPGLSSDALTPPLRGDDPPQEKTYGGAILHVITHNM
jgi:membrane protease YdiL (CAAX protease family)